jgi:hypothetical protein
MGPKSPAPQTQELFGYTLDQHLNLKHFMPGNPWDKHTLGETIEQVSSLTNIKPKTVIVDKGHQRG